MDAIWLAGNEDAVKPVGDMLTQLRNHSDMDYAIIGTIQEVPRNGVTVLPAQWAVYWLCKALN